MKNKLLVLFMSIGTMLSAQGIYHVNAVEGLTVRTKISGQKIGKIPYGYQVKVIEKSDPLVIKDDGKSISGNWVKIDGKSTQIIIDPSFTESYDPKGVYVFDGYLTEQSQFIKQAESKIAKHPALKDYYLATSYKVFALKGDFFADGVQDDVFRLISPEGNVRVMAINNKKVGSDIYGLGGPKDPFGFTDYDFDYFYRVPAKTPFWSAEFNTKPMNQISKNDIKTLGYDAIYIHDGKWKGGYIYRMNKKWNLLK
ncbi:SH3 domain-containing protein [Faecalibacter bovis]|nr:SH3 domain-containing protein [Faecalibacter bovis]